MKYLILIFFVLFSFSSKSQSFSIAIDDSIKIYRYSPAGKLNGKFIVTKYSQFRSGYYQSCFDAFIQFIRNEEKQMDLMKKVLDLIEPDGTIRYPIEFKKAWEDYYKVNQRF